MNIMRKLKLDSQWLFYFFLLLFCGWGLHFIYRTSAIGLDGNRYWVLFDDAMISMRYALNLVNGFGLTWNPGEYVEGFTNPLWTLVMAVAIFVFGKFTAPLIIQLLGLLLIIGTVVLTKKCADKLMGRNSRWSFMASLLVLTYYPLMYWSLSGMEVSALAFCTALALYIAVCVPTKPKALIWIYSIICISYLIRPDGFLALLPTLFISHQSSQQNSSTLRSHHFRGAAALLLTVAAITAARYMYYGELVPNTYTLKVSGYDLAHRLQNGINFIIPFLESTVILWALACVAVYARRKEPSSIPLCLVSMPVISILYQVYVGGDPWLLWRQLSPSMIPLVTVAVLGLKGVIESLKFSRKITLLTSPPLKSLLLIASLSVWLMLNNAFFPEIFRGKPFDFAAGERLIQMANVLNDVLPQSRILVFWAGSMPYYYNGYSIDALGKSDKYIASLPPDYTVTWNGIRGMPGHAKYSLQYDMAYKSPDFLQLTSWNGKDILRYTDANFVAVSYKERVLCIRDGAGHIRWDLVQRLGSCSEYRQYMP